MATGAKQEHESATLYPTQSAVAPPLVAFEATAVSSEADSELDDDPESQRHALRKALSRTLGSEYEVGDVLGQGAFGVVFRARTCATGEDVAIKVLRLRDGQRAVIHLARFQREAALCATLEHPNIVRLLGTGGTAALRYAVYELVSGETLRSLLIRERRLSPRLAFDLMGQALDALAYAHTRGIVHRDLKPENLMLARAGDGLTLKVLDFGVGTWVPEARGSEFQDLTLTREAVGTPSYSAPEQLRGDPPTIKSDLYAWGLVLLECLTGVPVVRGATLAEIYQQHLSPTEIPLPGGLMGHPLGEFLRRVLRKKPSDRAGDAAALYREFLALRLPEETQADVFDTQVIASVTQAALGVPPAPELRQITALACDLTVVPSVEAEREFEVLDAIHRDQLALCRDELTRFGGVLAPGATEQILVYFGYPTASDTDARRAARTAMDVAERVAQRGARLKEGQGVSLALRVGIHTGTVLSIAGEVPSGITPSTALRLASVAPDGSVVVSDSTRRVLENRLEFDPFQAMQISGRTRPISTFLLVGERQPDALGSRASDTGISRMLGRGEELARLKECWIDVCGGHGRAVLICGEPGIGKSRLLGEFIQSIAKDGRVFVCRCLAEQQGVALAPILELLRQRLGLREVGSSQHAASVLADALHAQGLSSEVLVPIFCSWLSLAIPEGYTRPDLSAQRQRELLLAAVAQMLPQLDGDGRVVFAVEDVHWADLTTLELLARLRAGNDRDRLLMVLTSRLDSSSLDVLPDVEQLELARLSTDDARELVRQLLGRELAVEETERTILRRADGIPLFLEELARIVLDDDRREAFSSSGARSRPAIPITLRDLLAERLDRLGTARSTAQLAAALGRDFDRALLIATSPEAEAKIDLDLAALVDANLLSLQRRVGASVYGFRHALIRDAAYESMPRDVRRENHARIARVLSGEFPSQTTPAELSRHYAEAGDYAAAVQHGTRAAQLSLERSANPEALAQASVVLEWLEQMPEQSRTHAELDVRGIATQALMAIHGWANPSVREQAERSRTLLRKGAALHHTVATLFALFMHYHVASDRGACRAVAHELWDFASNGGDASLQAVAATAEGVRCHAEGRFTEAGDWLERALALYDPVKDRGQGAIYGLDCRAWASAQLALVQWGAGNSARALELSDAAIAWSREIRHIPSLGIALLYQSQIHQMNGDRASVLRTTGELLAAAASYGLPAFEGYGAAIRAWAQNDYDGVSAIIQILERMNCNLILSYYGSYLADIELFRGEQERALVHIESCLSLCNRLDEHCFEPELHRRWAACELLSELPRMDRVRGALERAASLAKELGMYRFEVLAHLDLERTFGPDLARSARLEELQRLRPELRALIPARDVHT